MLCLCEYHFYIQKKKYTYTIDQDINCELTNKVLDNVFWQKVTY